MGKIPRFSLPLLRVYPFSLLHLKYGLRPDVVQHIFVSGVSHPTRDFFFEERVYSDGSGVEPGVSDPTRKVLSLPFPSILSLFRSVRLEVKRPDHGRS